MHNLLLRLLEKRGVKKEELKSDENPLLNEKLKFEEWDKVLSEGEVSVDKIKEFCKNQIKIIEVQWKNLDNDTKKNERLIILHTVYSTLINLIESPQTEKENLEKYLTELLNK
ncbi:MAG: hypothetical protein A2W47_04565 [Gammaproteobacteria bacterium RIFCSPHIGHO2_12_38_15]|nr:MAG: hypothetical protein A2W47_04565 [Gammaproteobacteria bacterium RIFCSPHIGHO2_12_38_15]